MSSAGAGMGAGRQVSKCEKPALHFLKGAFKPVGPLRDPS